MGSRNRSMRPEKKERIFSECGYRCKRCGKKLQVKTQQTVEHIIPISRGGISNSDNLICLCKKCNKEKSDSIVLPSSYFYKLSDEKKEKKDKMVLDWLCRYINKYELKQNPLVFEYLQFWFKYKSEEDNHYFVNTKYFQEATKSMSLFKLERDEIGAAKEKTPIDFDYKRLFDYAVAPYVLWDDKLKKIECIIAAVVLGDTLVIEIEYCKHKKIYVHALYKVIETIKSILAANDVKRVVFQGSGVDIESAFKAIEGMYTDVVFDECGVSVEIRDVE